MYFSSDTYIFDEFTNNDLGFQKLTELAATDPASPGGKKIDDLEKKKVFEAIKNIEDKILKIKLAIDKNK